MKKLIFTLILLAAAILLPKVANAAEISHPSAQLSSGVVCKIDNTRDRRVAALKNVLERRGSPLAEYASMYVKYADQNGVDWKLLPAISGLESSFGLRLMPGSYNAYGWGGGYIYFESWEDGINTINKALRTNYMDKWGATDVWSIGPIYAESPTWAVRVNGFMEDIDEEYKKLSTFALAPNI